MNNTTIDPYKKLKFEKADRLLEELRDITIKEKEKYFQKRLEKILPEPEHIDKQNKTWNDCLKTIKVYANIQ